MQILANIAEDHQIILNTPYQKNMFSYNLNKQYHNQPMTDRLNIQMRTSKQRLELITIEQLYKCIDNVYFNDRYPFLED